MQSRHEKMPAKSEHMELVTDVSKKKKTQPMLDENFNCRFGAGVGPSHPHC